MVGIVSCTAVSPIYWIQNKTLFYRVVMDIVYFLLNPRFNFPFLLSSAKSPDFEVRHFSFLLNNDGRKTSITGFAANSMLFNTPLPSM